MRLSTSSSQFVPSRQGVHWPQDSWAKNFASRATERTMQVVSSITMTAAEPEHGAGLGRRCRSRASMSISSGVRIGAEAPPGMTALSFRPFQHAAAVRP